MSMALSDFRQSVEAAAQPYSAGRCWFCGSEINFYGARKFRVAGVSALYPNGAEAAICSRSDCERSADKYDISYGKPTQIDWPALPTPPAEPLVDLVELEPCIKEVKRAILKLIKDKPPLFWTQERHAAEMLVGITIYEALGIGNDVIQASRERQAGAPAQPAGDVERVMEMLRSRTLTRVSSPGWEADTIEHYPDAELVEAANIIAAALRTANEAAEGRERAAVVALLWRLAEDEADPRSGGSISASKAYLDAMRRIDLGEHRAALMPATEEPITDFQAAMEYRS